jgi:AbrB family looped-hinge helix DNA binding protein
MNVSTLTSKGQTTIPKDIRDRLGLKPGDKIKFMVNPDGSVTLVAANLSVRQLRGILPRPERPATIEEMSEAIADAVVERHLRSTKP